MIILGFGKGMYLSFYFLLRLAIIIYLFKLTLNNFQKVTKDKAYVLEKLSSANKLLIGFRELRVQEMIRAEPF